MPYGAFMPKPVAVGEFGVFQQKHQRRSSKVLRIPHLYFCRGGTRQARVISATGNFRGPAFYGHPCKDKRHSGFNNQEGKNPP
ncbi:hypothetical protein JTE90_027463 [Oedothorax gibbosus]|uniref:Uncharacterized protein n=1 Tax=Oedothorax gibbosus TaxID=931172 RepID=A0AAV6TL28_9ARAC|nr:hypothetical protein JTE90_027463 [Oedothorax gibbosus]